LPPDIIGTVKNICPISLIHMVEHANYQYTNYKICRNDSLLLLVIPLQNTQGV